jgi:hypothetical protein
MKKFRIFCLILTLLAVITFTSACKFPDSLPDWKSIKEYRPDLIQFGTTTADDFAALVQSKPDQTIGDIVFFVTEPPENSFYKKVRVGFKENKLDWIEFTLNDNFQISRFTEVYGKPFHINNTYSNILDYYDYGFFNISTDKQHIYAKAITIFEIPKVLQTIDLGKLIPDWKNLSTANFLGLKPGYSLETDFNSSYPELIPVKAGKNSLSVYILDRELGKAKSQYRKIELVFNNGLLNWVSLIPQDIYLDQVIKIWGSQYTLESINTKYDLYDFSNTVIVVDKKNKKVVKIGIISAK